MAGGTGRGHGTPLSRRIRPDLAGPGGAPAAAPPARPDSPARHCWVAGAVDAEGVKRPGLLLEWRQVPHGPGRSWRWEGRVVYVARLRPLDAGGGWVAVEEWLPAELLLPL